MNSHNKLRLFNKEKQYTHMYIHIRVQPSKTSKSIRVLTVLTRIPTQHSTHTKQMVNMYMQWAEIKAWLF